MKKKYYERIGWYGVTAILLAYVLLNMHIIKLDSIFYQLLNLTGAISIVLDAYKDKNYQPVVLNIVWAIIAIIALISII